MKVLNSIALGMNPYTYQYPVGELVAAPAKGEFKPLTEKIPVNQAEYTLFRLPNVQPDEAPHYAFHHGIGGTLKMYTRKVGMKQGLRIPLQTTIGETYTVQYHFERERVLGDPKAASAPSACVRVSSDLEGSMILQEKNHTGSFSTTYQETASLTFKATHGTSFLFLFTETPSLETGLSWVTFQELQTDAQVADLTHTLTVNPYYLTPGESLSGTYEGDISIARLFVNGVQQSIGGNFNDGQFSYFVPNTSLTIEDQVMLVGLNAKKEVQVVAPVSVIQLGECLVHPFKMGQDTYVTGTYQKATPIKAQITINGVPKALGGTFEKGTFSYYVGTDAISLGSTVTLAFYDANGYLIEEQPVHFYGAKILKAHYGFGRSSIEGTYEGNVSRFNLVKESSDGTQTVLGWGGTLFSDETPKRFSFWVKASALKESDQLWLTPFNEQDQALNDEFPVTVEQTTLQVAPYYLGESFITGTYTGPIKGAFLYGGGTDVPLRKGGDFYEDGHFRFYSAGLDLSQSPVTLVPYNGSGDLLTVEQEINIRKGKLLPDAYFIGANFIKGSYTGDIQLAKLQVNDDPSKISWGGTFEKNQFSFYVHPSWITKTTDVLSLTGYSSSSEVIDGAIRVPIQTDIVSLRGDTSSSSIIEGLNRMPVQADYLQVNEQQVERKDLAIEIQEAVAAGKDTVYLKPASEVLYLVGEQGATSLPKDVTVSLIGAKDAQNKPLSKVQMVYRDVGELVAKYMVNFKSKSKNITIEGIQLDLAQAGRGGLYFEQVDTINIRHCQFGGYDFSEKGANGHENTDSNIMLTSCQNVWIEDNRFENNTGTNEDDQLNRCITIQEKNFNQSYSENIFIRRNTFNMVCQGVVISTKGLKNFQGHQNLFEKLGDNAFYALQLQHGVLTENTFSGLDDEAFVLGANRGFVADPVQNMTFEVIGNSAQNVGVKFVGINGKLKEMALFGNKVVNQLDKGNRPAVLAWRPNTDAESVERFLVGGNVFNIDTQPSSYDVFPLGSVTHAQVKENRVTMAGLDTFQKVFTFTGGMFQKRKREDGSLAEYLLDNPISIDTLLFLRNIWEVREGGVIQPKAILLRGNQKRTEDSGTDTWWKVPISQLIIGGPTFPATNFQNPDDYSYRTYY